MKLAQFKKDCEAVGLDWKLVKKRTKEAMDNFESLLADMGCPEDILFNGFIWEDSPEGYVYWKRYHKKLEVLHIIAKKRAVCDYEVRRDGRN